MRSHGPITRPGSFVLVLTLLTSAACGHRRPPDAIAYDENGARPFHGGRCADSEYVVVTNKSSHIVSVLAAKSGANGWHGDYEKVQLVLPGAVDTVSHYRKELDLSFNFEDQQYMSGMPVPISGLSVQCVKSTD